MYRERDTTTQLIGPIDSVISVLVDLMRSEGEGRKTWEEVCDEKDGRLQVYDGVQDVE